MQQKEADSFRTGLRAEAVEASKLFRTAQRLLVAFRCAAKMGDMTTVHIRDFVTMCDQCQWTKQIESDDEDGEDDGEKRSSDQPHVYIAPDLQEEQTRLEQERLAATFARNKAMEAAGRHSGVAALWREQASSASSSSSAGPLKEPSLSRFDIKASLGSGIQRRHIRSTVAVHNVLNALSTRENRSLELVKVSRHAAREAFAFCAKEGADTSDMEEFCMMILLFAKHFFPEANEEFGHIYAMDRLWDHSIAFFVEEYTTSTLERIAQRLPIATFPGMDLVRATYGEVVRLSYTLVGGGSPVSWAEIVRFIAEAEICKSFEHVTVHDIEEAFLFAKDQQAALRRMQNAKDSPAGPQASPRSASPLGTVPEGCIDEHGFLDFIAMLGFFTFSMEPSHSQFPTLASKCEQFILFLADWYHCRSGHVMKDEVQEPQRDLPQVVSMEPMSLTPSGGNGGKHNAVVMVGKLFPSKGVYVRFGPNHVTMTTPRDPDLGTNTVYPPPIDLNRVEILLRVDDDDPSAAECVVRRFTDVRISVSADGIIWNPFRGRRFVYERLEAPVPVALYLPRMQRVFVHYASAGGTRPVDGYINVAEWIQFCRDYRFLPTIPDPEVDETATPAYRTAMSVFKQYCVDAHDSSKPKIDGVKPRMIRALSSHNFSRGILNLFVSSGIPVVQGLANSFASDQWIGRQSLPDVPEAKLGGHALTIRRAAKGSAMSRRAEGVGERQMNSPRGGRISLVESDVLDGVDPEDALDISSFANGQWSNEGELSKMVFRFLTTGDKDCIDNLALRQNALDSMSHRVHVKGMETLPTSTTVAGAGGDGAMEASMSAGRSSVNVAKDAVAEARERTKEAVSQAIVVNHRNTLNAVSRRSLDANERHKRQVQRMQLQIQEMEAAKATMEETMRKTAKNSKSTDDAPLLHHTGDGVLQAEKEALHRVFVYELEKRKAALLAQNAREENLRDIERNRVLKEMKDRLVDSDVSFGRLQDVVIGQSETIEKQADVLRLLKDRATILTADVMYYRAAHAKLLTIVCEDPDKKEVVQTLNQEKVQHEVNVETVLTDMRLEAKNEGKKGTPGVGVPGMKELVKIQKQKAAARGTPTEQATPLSAADFLLPKAPKMKVSLTAEEAEERTREAVSAVQEAKNAEIEQLVEQLTFLRHRVVELGGDEEDEEEEEEEYQDGADHAVRGSDGGRTSAQRTPQLSRSSRRGKRGRSTPGIEIEIQTEPVCDGQDTDPQQTSWNRFAAFFGPNASSNIIMHNITPTDTFQSIAAHYHVPVDALFLANFIEPPVPASQELANRQTDEAHEHEMKLLLLGIASKRLRVPVSDMDGVSPGGDRAMWRTSFETTSQSSRGGSRAASTAVTPLKASRGLLDAAAHRRGSDPLSLQTTPRGSKAATDPLVSQQEPTPSKGNNASKPPLASRAAGVYSSSGRDSSAAAVAGAAHEVAVSPRDGSLHCIGPASLLSREQTPMAPWPVPTHDEGDLQNEDLLASSAGSPQQQKGATGVVRLGSKGAGAGGFIPGMMTIQNDPSSCTPDAVTPRLDPLLDLPDTVAVRQTYSFTPNSLNKRAERVVKRSEDQLLKATNDISEVIASVSSKVMEAGHAHLYRSSSSPSRTDATDTPTSQSEPAVGATAQQQSFNVSRSLLGSRDTAHETTVASSIETEPLDRMTAYVETTCQEAKKFQSSFMFQWAAPNDTEHCEDPTLSLHDVESRFLQPSHNGPLKGPVLKPKRAAQQLRNQPLQPQRGPPVGPAHSSAVSHEHENDHPHFHPNQDQQGSKSLEDRLRAVSAPDWLVVVSAPVRDLVQRTLETSSSILAANFHAAGGDPHDEEARNIYYRQRLFAKALRHFLEAELLQRLLIVRATQEFFQSCVQRYLVMRGRLERDSLRNRVERAEQELLAGTTNDHRAATAEREALRMEIIHVKQDEDRKNETARRRELEKTMRSSRKALQEESRADLAAQNAKEKKIVQELAKLQREAPATRSFLPRPQRPRFLAPLPPETTLDGLRIPTAVQRMDERTSSSPPPSSMNTCTQEEMRETLEKILMSPVKLQAISNKSIRSPPPSTNHTSATASSSLRFPSAAMDQIEMVAKAEAILLNKRSSS